MAVGTAVPLLLTPDPALIAELRHAADHFSAASSASAASAAAAAAAPPISALFAMLAVSLTSATSPPPRAWRGAVAMSRYFGQGRRTYFSCSLRYRMSLHSRCEGSKSAR